MELARHGIGNLSIRPQSPARAIGAIQGAHDFQINNSSINVVGGDSHTHTHIHTHTHVHRHGTAKALRIILDAVFNYRKIQQDMLAKATPGTILWVFDCEEFRLFIDVNGGLKIMWGSGIPGAGKTILASIVIEWLEALAKARGNQICVAYIYIRYSDQNQLTLRGILEVLVKQTLERHSDCMSLAQKAYDRHLQEGTQPTEEELLELLRQFAGKKTATFYILDALDEAPLRIRLTLIRKLSSLGVRLFITSRPLPAIQARFPSALTFPICARSEDLDLHIAEKIEASEHLQDLLRLGGPDFEECLITTVKANCGGMFLHASLQLDVLQQCFTVYDAMHTLRVFPQSIEDVYQQTWERITLSEPHHASLAKAALVWFLNAKQSLSIDQLRHALATCPNTFSFEPSRLMPEAALMSICHGLITIDEESRLVRLIHYTAKKPLQDLLRISFPHPHSLFAAVCVACLADCGFQNATGTSARELMTALRANPFLYYAYNAWAFHAQESLHLDFIARRISTFIAGCRNFPDIIESSSSFVIRDVLGPLHLAALYNLPITFAGPRNAHDTNAQTAKERRTPLQLACLHGHLAAAQNLLRSAGILVNVRDSDGGTALVFACRKGHEGIVRLLLAHSGIEVNLVEIFEKSFRTSASRPSDEIIVKLLLSHPGIEVNVGDDGGGDTPLIAASRLGHRGILMHLLTDPRVDVNLANKNGVTPLLVASSREGNSSTAKLLLAHPKIKVNLADNDGITALIRASERGVDFTVKLLLTHTKIDINRADNRGYTPLIAASQEGFQEIVKLFLAHPSIQVNSVTHEGNTALIEASGRGHSGVARLLLAHPSVKLNLVNDNGDTALLRAVSTKHNAYIVKLLLAHPDINVNLVDEHKRTALRIASLYGNGATIRLLLAHPEIEVNVTDYGRWTPLICASHQGHHEAVKPLLAHPSIEVNSRNNDGDTALTIASRLGHDGVVTLLLADPRIKVNLANCYGYTALRAAAFNESRASIIKPLLAHPDIDINLADRHGDTPLINACRAGHESSIALLLADPRTKVDLVNKDGDTALALAAFSESNASAVKLLLAHLDVDVNLTDKDGYTTLINASRDGFESIITLLLAHPTILVNLLNRGKTALIVASSCDGNGRTVQLLLAHPKIEVNLPGKHGNTAIMVASFLGHKTIVGSLLAAPGIDVNRTNEYGATAIKMAAEKGYEDIVRMLLKVPGINTWVKCTWDGHTAASAALARGHQRVVRVLQKFEEKRMVSWGIPSS